MLRSWHLPGRGSRRSSIDSLFASAAAYRARPCSTPLRAREVRSVGKLLPDYAGCCGGRRFCYRCSIRLLLSCSSWVIMNHRRAPRGSVFQLADAKIIASPSRATAPDEPLGWGAPRRCSTMDQSHENADFNHGKYSQPVDSMVVATEFRAPVAHDGTSSSVS